MTLSLHPTRSVHDWGKLLTVIGLASGLATGCATPSPKDYSAFVQYMPRSILVLPPLNESVDVKAPYSWITTVSEPLAELGYYVYPVVVISEFMKENGLPEPADMQSVPLAKFKEIIGPDAVLYATLTEFGQKFEVLSSNTKVSATARLVDVDTGTEIWSGDVEYAEGSSSSNGRGLLADLLTAAATQVSSTVSDETHDAARLANYQLLRQNGEGLLLGPLHPEFATQQAELAEAALSAEAAPVEK